MKSPIPPRTPEPTEGPLNAEHRRELDVARARTKSIAKAARVANVNGWTTAVIAAFSLLLSLGSIPGMLITVGLAVVAFNEFRGRKRLLQFDPAAATLLGRNQLGFLAMIVVYCCWMLWSGLTGPVELPSELKVNADAMELLGSPKDVERMYHQFVLLLYGSVIAASIVVQGLNAWYYFKRRKDVEALRNESPAWALDLLRQS